MPAQFTNFRLSLIWVETIPSILEQKLDSEVRSGFLQEPGRFAQTFDELARRQRAGAPAEPALALPWPRLKGHLFWKHYFAGVQAGDITGATAWKKHVPVRGKPPFRITGEQTTPKPNFEAFYFPQGLGLVATVYYRGAPKTPLELAALAQAVRYRDRFNMLGDPAKHKLSLQSVVDNAMAALRRAAFGDVEAPPGFQQPFTVATFVQGEVDEADAQVAEGSDVHRALEALTGWNESFMKMDLKKTPIESARLTIRSRLDSDLVYARESGRAIWLPREFTRKLEQPKQSKQLKQRKLSCYHRNVTLASLVTMSLGDFVSLVARKIDRKETVLPLLVERAKRPAYWIPLPSAIAPRPIAR